MSTISAIAHLNELTKDVTNDYYLTPQVKETLDVNGIIDRLKKREIATKNVDGKAFVQTFLDECADATAEGCNIVNSFFRSSLGIQGVAYAEDLGHNIPAERLKVAINLTAGEGARKTVENAVVYIFEQSGATGPVIQGIMDPTEQKADHLNINSMVLIQGMRLSLKGDSASVGILFTNANDSTKTVFIAPAKVYPNTPTKLQFVLPAEVAEGKWLVEVTTQASGSSTVLLKEPRTYQYPELVKVGNIPDEERPGEL